MTVSDAGFIREMFSHYDMETGITGNGRTQREAAENADRAALVGPDGFHRESVSQFVRVQSRQSARLANAMRLTDAELLAAFAARSPAVARQLAHAALSDAIRREMIAAHKKGV